MKWNFKRDIFVLSMIFLSIVISLYFYNKLPDVVPIHMNGNGMPDNYASKSLAFTFNIAGSIFIYLLLTFIPYLDPFRKKIEKKYNVVLLFRDITVIFIAFFSTSMFISTKINNFLGFEIAVLFIFFGNYMPKLPQNYFIGIRSPWTLASDVVWVKTHRIGGILFVIAGLLIAILSLFKVQLSIIMSIILIPLVGFTAFIYPFYIYKKLEKESNS
jgi:uncharacterized membrane protein